jgi:hypothetical protein
MLTDIWLRLGHAMATKPWVRIAIGLAMIVFGIVELITGAGTGRTAVFGVIIILGTAMALRHSHRPPDSSE